MPDEIFKGSSTGISSMELEKIFLGLKSIEDSMDIQFGEYWEVKP